MIHLGGRCFVGYVLDDELGYIGIDTQNYTELTPGFYILVNNYP